MQYVVYILLSQKEPKTYTGHTDNLKRRLHEHNSGKSIFSKRYRPWKVLYKEIYNTETEAIKREEYLKSAAGRRLIKKKLFSAN